MDKCLHHLNALLSELTAEATVDQDIDSWVDNCKKIELESWQINGDAEFDQHFCSKFDQLRDVLESPTLF